MSLADRLRGQGDMAARPGQMDAMYAIADEVETLEQERDRMRTILNELGFCPKDGESMPCFTCGAGL